MDIALYNITILDTGQSLTIAVKTLGPWNDEGLALIAEFERRINMITADSREALFLFQ